MSVRETRFSAWSPCGAFLGGKGRIAEWLGWTNDGAHGRQKHVERQSGGSGRREVRGETRASVGVKARRKVHAHAGVVVEASLEKDAAVGYTFAMAILEPTLERGKVGGTRGGASLTAPHLTCHLHPTSALSRQLLGTRKKDACHAHKGASRHFKSSSGCFLLVRIAGRTFFTSNSKSLEQRSSHGEDRRVTEWQDRYRGFTG